MKIINLYIVPLTFICFLSSCVSSEYSSEQAEKDIKNGVIKILKYGDYVKIVNCDKADAKFNITHVHTGFRPTKGIKQYNEVVEKYLYKTYGDDFWEKYKKLCDSIK